MTVGSKDHESPNTIDDLEFINMVEFTVKLSMEVWKHAVPALTIEMIDVSLE